MCFLVLRIILGGIWRCWLWFFMMVWCFGCLLLSFVVCVRLILYIICLMISFVRWSLVVGFMMGFKLMFLIWLKGWILWILYVMGSGNFLVLNLYVIIFGIYVVWRCFWMWCFGFIWSDVCCIICIMWLFCVWCCLFWWWWGFGFVLRVGRRCFWDWLCCWFFLFLCFL